MKLYVLADNYVGYNQTLCGEHGASYYIEDGPVRILLDTGASDLFLQNAEKLNIDLASIQYLVLSHGHSDHTAGLRFFMEKYGPKVCRRITLIAHPDLFSSKKDAGKEIGCPVSLKEVSDCFEVRLTDRPFSLSAGLTYLGEIPRKLPFENQEALGTILKEGKENPDFLTDDSALAFNGNDGVYVITGCSHSGICNITEQAKAVTGKPRVLGIAGGFHLLGESDQLTQTVAYLKKEQIPELYPAHCTSYEARFAINREMPIKVLGAGLILNWE
ncbi:MAG: MBL fold metallo-hydrolase [Lachnospiraceae bacterium]|nr:MBL fold metallo-hydrolase [Lachnospiraceae bacterium]